MAITRSQFGLDVLLEAVSSFFHHQRNRLADAMEKRRVYQQTYHELSSLSDRELADLGIARSSIRMLAQETVYGG